MPRDVKRAFLNSVAHDMGFHAEFDLPKWNNLQLLDIMQYTVCDVCPAGAGMTTY